MEQKQCQGLKHFLDELTLSLETAKAIERESDKSLAQKFNVLDFVRSDELGLSAIISNLLDPHASHGQGSLFLRTLLTNLCGKYELFSFCSSIEDHKVSVESEKTIQSSRRLDILEEIVYEKEKYCLAIENKPFSNDQKRQVADYADYRK